MQASVILPRGLSIWGSQALEHNLDSCGAEAQWLCSMWDPPRLGIEPGSPGCGSWGIRSSFKDKLL